MTPEERIAKIVGTVLAVGLGGFLACFLVYQLLAAVLS